MDFSLICSRLSGSVWFPIVWAWVETFHFWIITLCTGAAQDLVAWIISYETVILQHFWEVRHDAWKPSHRQFMKEKRADFTLTLFRWKNCNVMAPNHFSKHLYNSSAINNSEFLNTIFVLFIVRFFSEISCFNNIRFHPFEHMKLWTYCYKRTYHRPSKTVID